jgi:Fur family ferric uptake transcriptional regulator
MNSAEIKEELNQKGIKNTRAKSILLHILKQSNTPKDVNSLHQECSKSTTVNLATVYRTLRQFHEKKIVQEFLGSDGIAQYEYIHQGTKSHPHFQCEVCQKIVCLGELKFEDALYFSNMAKQHKINTINIMLVGICEHCQETL